MRSAAVLCPACGAPLEQGFDDGVIRCRYCGTTKPLEPARRSALRRHLWRIRRAEQKARCILREHITALLLPDLVARAKIYLYGGLALVLVLAPLLGFGGAALVELDTPLAAISGVIVIVAAGISATVGFPLGLFLAFREGKAADRDAARAARVAGTLADTTLATRCAQCGGYADVVVIGTNATCPCPWCGAQLVAQGADAERTAAAAILLGKQQNADAALTRARARISTVRRRSARLQLPGYELRGGVYEGSALGIPSWIAFDILDLGVHRRLELDCDVPLEGAVWFVRRELASLHARAVEQCRVAYPGPAVATDPELDPYYVTYAESGVNTAALTRAPSLRALLGRLSSSESLHLDPAGGSIWHLGGSLFGVNHREVLGEGDALAGALSELARQRLRSE